MRRRGHRGTAGGERQLEQDRPKRFLTPFLMLTVAMRKLLVILNAMLRDHTAWNPDRAATTNL
jgi:hypothetical protein